MRKPICIQRVSDNGNTPVHHIGRSNDICTGFRLGNGNFRQQFQRGIIIHFMTAELPAVSGISILAETHITYNNKIGKFFLIAIIARCTGLSISQAEEPISSL